MNTGAIVTIIVMWAIFIGSFGFFFSRLGKGGGKWED
ncbi:hypothetical protein ES703_73718 [subsurface metagenome]